MRRPSRHALGLGAACLLSLALMLSLVWAFLWVFGVIAKGLLMLFAIAATG